MPWAVFGFLLSVSLRLLQWAFVMGVICVMTFSVQWVFCWYHGRLLLYTGAFLFLFLAVGFSFNHRAFKLYWAFFS
jgi:hypothetical protein